MRSVRFRRVLASITVALAASATFAQGAEPAARYPERPIRFIVPFPPGAANDMLARAVGRGLAERLGQSVVADNRGGAGGMLGTGLAARSAPDGYTIVVVPATHAINATLHRNPPYDAIRDFAPVALMATGPYMLVVSPSLGVSSVKELVSLARSKPGRINYASAGVGNATHLIAELMKSMAGIDMTHVPYKGGTPALTDVMAGRADLYFGTVAATSTLARTGKVRALGVTSARRSAALPDVPTLDEAGVTGFDAVGWWGILAPAGTPAYAITRLNREVAATVSEPAMQQWLRRQGFEPAGGSAGEFRRHIEAEIVKWGKVVKISGATPN